MLPIFCASIVLLSTLLGLSESSPPIVCPPVGQKNISIATQNRTSSTASPSGGRQNATTIGVDVEQEDDVRLPDMYTVIAGSLAFLVTFPFAVYHIPRVALESTGAVLIGAVLMVLLGVLTQDDVYEILGIGHVFYMPSALNLSPEQYSK